MKLFDWRPGAFLVLVGLTVLGLSIYANAIFHPFVHDDVVFIEFNPNISRWDNIGEAFSQPGVPFRNLRITTPYYRPVLEVLYRAQHAMFGMKPAGFHLFNILLHIANSFLVFWVARFWGFRRLGAAMVAALFLAHPMQSEAVACVSGISNLAVALPLLLSFVLYSWGRVLKGKAGVAYMTGAAFVFLVALFTKEQAVFFPFFLLAYEMMRKSGKVYRAKRNSRLAVFFLLAGLYFILRGQLFPDHLSAAFSNWPEFWLRILSIPRTILMYAGLLVWPAGLHYYRSIDILTPPGWSWGVLVSVGAAVAYTILRMPWRWKRKTVAGFAWGFIFMIPALNIVPLINEYSLVLAAEHFVYLSLVGFLAGAAGISGWVFTSFSKSFADRSRTVFIWKTAIFVSVIAIFSCITVWQNRFWRGEVPLFERTLQFEPGLGRVHLLLARAYLGERKFVQALSEYEKGLNIMQDYVNKSHNSKARLAYLQFVKGVHRDRGQVYMILGDLQRSSEEYRKSLSIGTDGLSIQDTGIDDSQTANNLALNLLRGGDRSEAERWWWVSVRINPRNTEAWNNLGMLALERKDKTAAIYYFKRSLQAAPGFLPAEQNLKKADQL